MCFLVCCTFCLAVTRVNDRYSTVNFIMYVCTPVPDLYISSRRGSCFTVVCSYYRYFDNCRRSKHKNFVAPFPVFALFDSPPAFKFAVPLPTVFFPSHSYINTRAVLSRYCISASQSGKTVYCQSVTYSSLRENLVHIPSAVVLMVAVVLIVIGDCECVLLVWRSSL